MGSTGSDGTSRRAILEALGFGALAACGLPARAEATEYASAAEVLDTVDRLEGDVASRLHAIVAVLPSARPFADSVLADFERHRGVRARLRERLGLRPRVPPTAAAAEHALEPLRAAQEALVYAHAEGLPALGAAFAVDALARNMVDLSRHLAVTGLWIDTETQRG